MTSSIKKSEQVSFNAITNAKADHELIILGEDFTFEEVAYIKRTRH